MATESLRKQVIVLTGATSGFGRGAALRFTEAGADVVLAARRPDVLAQVASDCARVGGRAVPIPTDVSRAEDVERLAASALARFGRIDVWVNNAGVAAIGPFEKVPLADHVQVIETGLLGTLYGCYVAYRLFRAQREGVLINIASELDRTTVPHSASHTATQQGVVGLGAALRGEISRNGHRDVHVCTIVPKAHDAPFFDHVSNYTGHESHAPQPPSDPAVVIDAIIRIAADPKESEVAGWDGVLEIDLEPAAPGVAANGIRATPAADASRAPDSPGTARTRRRAPKKVAKRNRKKKKKR